MEDSSILTLIQTALRNGLGAPILVMALLAMLVVPLPPTALDIMYTFNITLSLVVLLATVYVTRPLELSVFPSVILVTTLLRLSLNVAATRVILMHGHTGTAAAGRVIEAFGEFVIGGNYAVGLVVFGILVIINFIVVTRGANRTGEVTARFTLDALPGKQMAIDADLNAGLISQEEATERRLEVRQEADFYGSMDGAAKFVRNDALAGILILFINIIGGLIIGMVQHGMPLSNALHNYTLLTIGDGLVAQLPSLLVSTAAAIIVTRVSSSKEGMSQQIISQLTAKPQIFWIACGILGLMGVIPGMPNLVFLAMAAGCGGLAYYLAKRQAQPPVEEEVESELEQASEKRSEELSWDDVHTVDIIGLEVGYRLIPLVDRNQGGELMSKIKGVRRKLSQELGFLVQAVHIRDNLDLAPNAYRISLLGVPLGEAEIYPDRELAINPGQVFGTVQGIGAKDPAFGLDAVWIETAQRDQAQTMGYTVVDPSTVIATHVSQILHNHAHELLGHEEVQKLLDVLSKSAPKLVEDLVPKSLSLGGVLKVLQNLLEEHIPIRDMRTIAETLAEHAPQSQDPGVLTAAVRSALGRSIVQHINGMAPDLPVITLDPALERILHQSIQASVEGGAGLEPALADQLHQALANNAQRQEASNQPAVLLVPPLLRSWLARLVRHSIPGLHVLSYGEVPDDKQIKVVATVGQQLPAQGAA